MCKISIKCVEHALTQLSACHRNFNQNLVRPRTNTEVEEFKKKKKGKKAPAGDDSLGRCLPDSGSQNSLQCTQRRVASLLCLSSNVIRCHTVLYMLCMLYIHICYIHCTYTDMLYPHTGHQHVLVHCWYHLTPHVDKSLSLFTTYMKCDLMGAADLVAADPVDPEMEPDTAQQDTQEAGQEQEEDDEADPVMLAKKQKQLAKRGVSFEAKVDPKVGVLEGFL